MGDPETLAGRVLAEKYRLTERLGEGGFSSIWRAEHQILKSPVAVKLIDLEVARKDGAVERFLREAQATAALRSPHVVQVLDYGVDGEQPFIAMELLEGENVADRLLRLGKLAPLEVVRIVTHVARAMGKAHELGIIHRDLKPENIFLVNNGDEEIAKVLDFGVAKFASSLELNQNNYTQTGSLIGTPYYMSPEQAQGNKTIDHRSDLWALGVIAFEMMTGKRPFDGDALGDLVLTICVRTIAVPSAVAQVPPGFDTWFARAVERDPDARFQSARELALSLLAVVSTEEGVVSSNALAEPEIHAPSWAETGIGLDIPSRPFSSVITATARDEVVAATTLVRNSQPSSPAIPAPALPISLEPLPDELTEDNEEHLTPWMLFGIALLAVAAGAAAVYGLYHLMRGHDAPIDPGVPSPLSSITVPVAPSASNATRHRSDVPASSKPNSNSESGNARAQRVSSDGAPGNNGRARPAASNEAIRPVAIGVSSQTIAAPPLTATQPLSNPSVPASSSPEPAQPTPVAPVPEAPQPHDPSGSAAGDSAVDADGTPTDSQ